MSIGISPGESDQGLLQELWLRLLRLETSIGNAWTI